MPILVLLLVFAALVYGAVEAFQALAARFGLGVALGVACAAAALLAALVAWLWRRRREVAPNLRDGDWTHGVAGAWGEVRLAAGKRLCDVQLDGAHGSYIFADLRRAEPQVAPDGWRVALHVADRERPLWQLPMPGEREARRWARIFSLAIAQRL